MLMPFSRFRTYWDLCTLSLVLYTALVLPYVLGFLGPAQATPTWMTVIDVIADLVFVADIVRCPTELSRTSRHELSPSFPRASPELPFLSHSSWLATLPFLRYLSPRHVSP